MRTSFSRHVTLLPGGRIRIDRTETWRTREDDGPLPGFIWLAGSKPTAGGFEEALVLAKKAAGSKDVKIGGGVATLRQYLTADLIDSLHIASVPILLGQGESLFDGLDLHALGFSVTERKTSEYATHLVLDKA